MKYLDDIDDPYSGLDMLDVGYRRHQKKQNLLNNITIIIRSKLF